MPSPEEIRRRIVSELEQIEEMVRSFLERIGRDSTEELEDDEREAKYKVRMQSIQWAQAEDLKEIVTRAAQEAPHEDTERESLQDDTAFQAAATAGAFDSELSSIDALVGWELALRGAERKLSDAWRWWADNWRNLTTYLRPRVWMVVSWVIQLISQLRTPKEWSIAGQISASPFGVGGSGQLQITFGQ